MLDGMKWAYTIEIYREQGDAEPTATHKGRILEHQLTDGMVFPFESYDLRVVEVVTLSRGGGPDPASVGRVKAVVQRDHWEEQRQIVEAKQEARRLGWRLVVEEESGYWQAWGAPGSKVLGSKGPS
jgi:hypothetical protein